MEENSKITKNDNGGWLISSLDFVWDKVVMGDSKFHPEKSCQHLALDYKYSGKTPEECAKNFIKWQTGKAGLAGFALGLPGATAMPITIPADFASTAYLQLRMIAVIGILFGWEATSDQLRTTAFGCLLGTVLGEGAHDIGVATSTRFGNQLVKNIPGDFLKKLNKTLRVHNLFIKGSSSGTKSSAKIVASAGTKTGSKGIVNLTKMVPMLGGIVGGGINIVATRGIGHVAIRVLKNGPPNSKDHCSNDSTAPN